MKVNIYYGGRGIIEDPTLYVIDRIEEVLRELRVEVNRYNLYEQKKSIVSLATTLRDVDGIILATTVEWLGIGGFMQQFLDACWLYCDKEKIKNIYMLPVVMASTYGEREGELTLINAWEILGGIPCSGICAYVEDHIEFETNKDYKKNIEKKAETFYRTISQQLKDLPSSNNAVAKNISRTRALNLTPQESEQLSVYVSDDKYVKKQKEDIKELTNMFKELLWNEEEEEEEDMEYIPTLQKGFHPISNFAASYSIKIAEKEQPLIVDVNNDKLVCKYGTKEDANVLVMTTRRVFEDIVKGNRTFQGAFMSGDINAKGDFKTLRTFDTLFRFDVVL